jgi:two-component system alkaline phosphatase synthesis response regulator PhoP
MTTTNRAPMAEGAKRVLIVEDDPSIMLGLRINLEAEGYAVLSAEDGERALVLVRTEPPDLVILDVMLPKMNGFQVLQTLRRGGTRCPSSCSARGPVRWTR